MSRRLSAQEAADRLGVSVRTVTRYVDAGLLKAGRTPGGHRRFDLDEVDQLLVTDPPPDPIADPADE